MRWLTLLATAAVALAEVEIITSPTPGNEYVKISGVPQGASNASEPKIQVEDEGRTGYQHKFHAFKKAEHISLRKETLGLKATVKDEGLSGVVKKNSGNGVPALKHMDDVPEDKLPPGKFDVVAPNSWKSKRDKDGLDFDDELPLSDKKLKPAGTSQASRVNVKKGPNGQDYEYEYVYYYYDEEDEDQPGPSSPAPANHRSQYTDIKRPSPTTRLPADDFEEPRNRGELIKQKNVDSGSEPTINHGRIPAADEALTHHRGGQRVVEVTEDVEEELPRRKTEHRQDHRYSTIDRGTSSRGRGEPVAVTTIEPSSNEVLPSRGSQRSRGRHVDSSPQQNQEVDDRLPANTRFPSRARGSSVGTTIPPTQPTSPSRTRSQSGTSGVAVRRPSLVDSSSFRTHSSDSAPDADLDKNYYRASSVQDTRESDLEEYIQPEQVRPTTFIPSQTTTPHPPAPLPEQPQGFMPDKAALDLYAIIQQQQEENSVSGAGGDIQGTVSVNEGELQALDPTTLLPTTITTTTTTTTTTTEAPTTTTTTTTTAAPPLAGRGRFKQVPGGRTRLRLGGSGSTTTTSTEAPQDEESAAPKRKFSPSHGARNPGQTSSYGRRGVGARSSTTTAAPAQDQESSTARPRASFGSNRNQYRARGKTTPAAHTDEETPSETTTASTAYSRPTRPRLNVSAATRPLRPGPRINLRARGGLSTPAPVQPTNAEDSPPPAQAISLPSSTTPPTVAPPTAEEEASPAPVAQTDALSRLRNRPRLKVTPRLPGGSSPTSAPAQRQLPQGFKRPGRPGLQQQSSPAEEAAPAPTEPAAAQTEAPVQVDQPASTEPPLAPHLARRRPAIRRLQIPSQHNQQQ